MAKNINELYADLSKFLDKLADVASSEDLAASIGFTVRYRMLQLISRGISPILGYGRFPEYKGALRRKLVAKGSKFARREIAKISSQIRATKASSIATGRAVSNSAIGRLRARKAHLKFLKSAAQKASQRGYPYDTKEYREGKKFPRPVNLFLTGEFLRSLTFTVKKVEKRAQITIGFFEAKQALKEKGHREGANGQARRPIIPRKSEGWAETIRLDIMKLLRDAITKAARSAKRG